jgi:hypothetical protein
MADYYPLIARAVAGLDKNTGENRRALYERARAALVNQLRGVDPPLDESDITRERLALEESIRRLEAEAAKRTRPDAPDETDDDHPSLGDRGLRDFRDTVAEVEGLGEASHEANRAARAAFREEPRDDARRGDAEHDEHYFEPPPQHHGQEDLHDHADMPAQDARHDEHGEHDELPAELPPAQTGWTPPPVEEHDDYARPPRAWGRIVMTLLLVVAIVGVAAAGYWQRGLVMQTAKSVMAGLKSSPPVQQAPKPKPTASEAGARPKIADRIGAADTPSAKPATAPAAAVAQKVVLYDEDATDPKGKRYVGSAVWRTETVSPGPGLAPELAIRADVEIPERRMRMTWSLRRNTDKALPASHTIEIMFTLPADFSEGGIANVPGVLMKQDEQARGVPLAGLAVKVTNGYFLIGLSAVGIDQQRNIQLLKERDWFDIPIVYTSGKRAILAVEKGTPGARAFEEAFRAWGE